LKRRNKILLIILGVVLILVIGILLFRQSLKPTYKGEIALPTLESEVSVYYDTYGIPHIYAASQREAFTALGYVHAQDRLWQMELLRRVARGGLSEVFGPDLIPTDKFFLSLGIDDATRRTLGSVDRRDSTFVLAQAYLDGINEFLDKGPTPVEFMLTGLEKEPFTMRDIYNSVGYMAFTFAQAHKTDPLLTEVKNTLGPAYLEDLQIDVDPETEFIQNYNGTSALSIEENILGHVSKALDNLPLPQFEGSNSWVIAPQKTKSGKVIFANDPHIGFAQPSVWYEAHVNAPGYEKYGYYLGGIPFPLLAHDRRMAYGMTMFENDDVDFYKETPNPIDTNQYKTAAGWQEYEWVTNRIEVKGEDPVEFRYKRTQHGPVINDVIDQVGGDDPISMAWIYTQEENGLLQSLHGISEATNLESFRKHLPGIHAPGLNVMYGDAEGNVAWWAVGKLYTMPGGTQTKLILDGASGEQEKEGFLEFDENPQAVNPPWNYVYSANNQPAEIAGIQYPGYYLPENRAKRIVDLLEPKDDWDMEAVEEMITDVTSPVNPDVVTNLSKWVLVPDLNNEEIQLLDHLSTWDGTYDLDSYEASIYHRWIYNYLRNTFEDEMGAEMFGHFLNTHLHKRIIAPLSEKASSVWFDNIQTPDVIETQNEIVHQAFKEAMESLEEDLGGKMENWTWDKLHTLEHKHPIGEIASFRSFFNVGPFPINGTREVINNMAFTYSSDGYYPVTSGPSTRRVIDFSDIENSMSILPTGQSGNPFSRHYRDQAKMYNAGEFRKMLLNEAEIKENKKSLLIFTPEE